MKLTSQQLNEFRELYKRQFGKELDEKSAYDYASKLLRLMELVYKPIRKADMDQADKRREELGANN